MHACSRVLFVPQVRLTRQPLVYFSSPVEENHLAPSVCSFCSDFNQKIKEGTRQQLHQLRIHPSNKTTANNRLTRPLQVSMQVLRHQRNDIFRSSPSPLTTDINKKSSMDAYSAAAAACNTQRNPPTSPRKKRKEKKIK